MWACCFKNEDNDAESKPLVGVGDRLSPTDSGIGEGDNEERISKFRSLADYNYHTSVNGVPVEIITLRDVENRTIIQFPLSRGQDNHTKGKFPREVVFSFPTELEAMYKKIRHKYIALYVGPRKINVKGLTHVGLEFSGIDLGLDMYLMQAQVNFDYVNFTGVVSQLHDAVKYLHKKQMAHTEIGLTAVWVEKIEPLSVRLFNLEHARWGEWVKEKGNSRSEFYTAPEISSHSQIPFENYYYCDWYALLVLFAELINKVNNPPEGYSYDNSGTQAAFLSALFNLVYKNDFSNKGAQLAKKMQSLFQQPCERRDIVNKIVKGLKKISPSQ